MHHHDQRAITVIKRASSSRLSFRHLPHFQHGVDGFFVGLFIEQTCIMCSETLFCFFFLREIRKLNFLCIFFSSELFGTF